jgi:putative hemin transport protein
MAEEVPDTDRSWDAGWEEHELQQLRRLARLPLWQKLQWLEEMNRIIRHLRTQRPAAAPPAGPNPHDEDTKEKSMLEVSETRPAAMAPELRQRIEAALRASPSQMTLQLSRQMGVPEVEVIRALPDGRAVELDPGRVEELIRAFEGLGKVHVIVTNGATTCEVQGCFGGFSTWGEFFNVQTSSLDMHIRVRELAAAFAVEKPGHMDGINTLSFQFYDRAGRAAFKVFLSFGGKEAAPDCQARFHDLRERFRMSAGG